MATTETEHAPTEPPEGDEPRHEARAHDDQDAPPPEDVSDGGSRGWFRRVVPVLLVLLTLGALGGGGYLAYTMLVDTVDGPDQEDVDRAAAAVEESVDEDVLATVRNVVGETHAEMNEALGYGRIDNLDIDEFSAEVGEGVHERLGEVLAEVDHDTLVEDLTTSRDLLEHGMANDDREALRWSHRILHDLDYFAFNPDEEGVYFEATLTLTGERTEAHEMVASLR